MAPARRVRILAWAIAAYVWASLLEWMLHKWSMHGLGLLGGVFTKLKTTESHVQHHRDTDMQQGLAADYHPEGLVYEPKDMLLTWLAFLPGALGLWAAFGGRAMMPAGVVVALTVLAALGYFWTWNSMHTAYHKVYLPANRPIPNPKAGGGATVRLWSPLPYFRPDKTSAAFRWLFLYHALHHLNKGVSKGNYNILLPLADALLGSYTPRVDNRAHFAANAPATAQEKWLSDHPVFEVRLGDGALMYREAPGDDWAVLPSK